MKNKIIISSMLIFILILDCVHPLLAARANVLPDEQIVTNNENDFTSNSLIVETSNIEEVKKDDSVENVIEVVEGVYIVDYIDESIAEEKFEDLSKKDFIDEIFEDVEISVLDTELSTASVSRNYRSWGVESTGMDHYIDYLNYKNNSDVYVAILDTGVNTKHEVFANKTTADRIDTKYSYNYIAGSNNIQDDYGHGTMVASIVAESTPSNVKIVPIKIANNKGRGTLTDLIEAIVAIKDNVDIINLSMGVKNAELSASSKETVEKVLNSVYDNGKGPAIICATGNTGASEVLYPASSNYTIAVSALKRDGNGNLSIASFSNYGSQVDFSAPGEDLSLADYTNNAGYVKKSGTSFAAPCISAAVALLKTEFKLNTIDEVKSKLKENADDLGSVGKDIYYGYGSINFITNKFEIPVISNIETISSSNKVIVNAVCDDNITKYACLQSGKSITSSDWINISNPSTNAKIECNVGGSGKYIIYVRDSEGQISSAEVAIEKNNETTGETTPEPAKKPSISYRTHVENVGWQGYVSDGKISGTTGKALRLEGIKILVQNSDISGSITYRTHVQDIGWQNYVSNGALSGTTGRALRLEAIQIKLTGEISNKYDVYYRVHCENIGWMGWAKNGESAGSAGYCYRLEAIQIQLVEKGGNAPGSTKNRFKQNIFYSTHVQDIGWQNYVSNGALSGTTGKALRLEAIRIKLPNTDISGNIEYSTHVQDIGWQGYVRNNAVAGTSGRALRLEAIKIRLTGNLANEYDIYYRVHCQNIGWMGWAKNGAPAGTVGLSYRLEAIQIVLVNKGEDP